jgi:hypothetical protein
MYEINLPDEMTFYLVNVIPWKSYNIFSGNETKNHAKFAMPNICFYEHVLPKAL